MGANYIMAKIQHIEWLAKQRKTKQMNYSIPTQKEVEAYNHGTLVFDTIDEAITKAEKISKDLLNAARLYAKVQHRSVAKQVEYWAQIGKIAEDNPDLPLSFIQDILQGREEIRQVLSTPYIFGEGKCHGRLNFPQFWPVKIPHLK